MNLVDMLIQHEGLKLTAYQCTAGKTTIGVGRNVDDLGITKEEAIYLLRNDIARVESELSQFWWFPLLTNDRKNALIDMCFNLGITRFKTFKKMIKYLSFQRFIKIGNQNINVT